MKTLREYINRLPEPFRSKAFANFEAQAKDKSGMDKPLPLKDFHDEDKNTAMALSCCFIFDEAPEGGNYWRFVQNAFFNKQTDVTIEGIKVYGQ